MAGEEFIIRSRPQNVWGWFIILDLFFTGAGAGLFLFALILGSMTHMLIGIILVFIGTLFLLADLSRPLNVWRVIMRPGSSWISRGAIGIAAFFILGILHLLVLWIWHGGWAAALGSPWTTGPALGRVFGVLSGCAALFVASYPGFLLGSMRSIPFWNGAYLPILFLITGLLGGLSVIYLVPRNWEGQTWAISMVENLGLALIILGFFLLASLSLMGKAAANRDSIGLLTKGALRRPYIIGVIGGGALIPLIILVLVVAGVVGSIWLPFAGICLALGALLLRFSILKAGITRTPIKTEEWQIGEIR